MNAKEKTKAACADTQKKATELHARLDDANKRLDSVLERLNKAADRMVERRKLKVVR